jgi:hypothetical protein
VIAENKSWMEELVLVTFFFFFFFFFTFYPVYWEWLRTWANPSRGYPITSRCEFHPRHAPSRTPAQLLLSHFSMLQNLCCTRQINIVPAIMIFLFYSVAARGHPAQHYPQKWSKANNYISTKSSHFHAVEVLHK